ncbi:MAG: hypothetical protein ACE5KF_04980 [Kiloniellaceae bacterium]
MIARRKSGPFLPAALLIVCTGLGWFIYQELQAASQPRRLQSEARSPARALRSLPAAPEYAMPPFDTFAAVVERPIFSPTRRPPPESERTVEAPPPELDLVVVGIIISAEEPIAIVFPKNGKSFVRLAEGDDFLGWTVVAIEPDRVTFRREDIEEQVELSYERPPPARTPRGKPRRQRERDGDTGETQ